MEQSAHMCVFLPKLSSLCSVRAARVFRNQHLVPVLTTQHCEVQLINFTENTRFALQLHLLVSGLWRHIHDGTDHRMLARDVLAAFCLTARDPQVYCHEISFCQLVLGLNWGLMRPGIVWLEWVSSFRMDMALILLSVPFVLLTWIQKSSPGKSSKEFTFLGIFTAFILVLLWLSCSW